MHHDHIWNNISVTQRHPGPGLPAEVETYSYSGERLSSYTPGGGATPLSFTHDALGRMTSDGLAGTQISYNAQDLPVCISKGDSIRVTFKYLSDGTKLEMTDSTGAGLLYRGPFIYRTAATGPNGTTVRSLESVPFEGGRLTAGGTLRHVTDHLGSVRAVVNAGGSPLAIDEYEPYGAWRAVPGSDGVTSTSHTPAGVSLRYRFTGKEDLTPDWALPYTDFGARLYSPALRRWLVPDKLSEKYYGINPYVYCAGNPVNLVDTDGNKLAIWYYDEEGRQRCFMFSGTETDDTSNSYVRDVITAYRYNKDNWTKSGYSGSSPLVKLIERKETTSIIDANIDARFETQNGGLPVIYWSPDRGAKYDTGAVSSPASILSHEADHANDAIDNLYEHNVRTSTLDLQYDTAEERRVIEGSEQKTAFANGELKKGSVTRKNHKAKTVFVVGGPTSTTIYNASKIKW